MMRLHEIWFNIIYSVTHVSQVKTDFFFQLKLYKIWKFFFIIIKSLQQICDVDL